MPRSCVFCKGGSDTASTIFHELHATNIPTPALCFAKNGASGILIVECKANQPKGSATRPSVLYNTASQPTQLDTTCTPTCHSIKYTYDQNTLRMKQYSGAFTNGINSGTLTWNPNGSLQTQVVSDPANPADSQTCNYAADDLGRISSANCGSNWAQTFAYDPFGNITKSGSISWTPGYTTSTNHYALGTTSYDANGNVLKDGSNTYTWDAEGKPLSTLIPTQSNQTYSFTYDAFGHKVEWLVNGFYEHSYLYIGKMKLSATGQTVDYSEFPLPGGSVLSFNGGATGLQMADWQGTIRNFFSGGGAQGQSGAHAPFGEGYDYSSGHALAFTGQQGDGIVVNGTEYFPERQYRNSQGRFISPDPIGMKAVDPSDPQTWNQYAYVGNRPLNHIDPQGTDDCTDFGICGGGGDGGGGGGCDPYFGCGGGGGCNWLTGCGGGGGFTINISVGPGGVSVGGGFTGGGDCFGVPCDNRVSNLARSIGVAIKNKNWGALLGIGLGQLGALEQNLINANGGQCEFGGVCFGAQPLPANSGRPSPLIEEANKAFEQCVAGSGKAAALKGAVGALSEHSKTPIVNMVEAGLDAQKECLAEHPLADLSPNYKGLFTAGDPGVYPIFDGLLGVVFPF